MSSVDKKEPRAIPNDLPGAHDLIIKDLEDRRNMGQKKHGTLLQPFNGRNNIMDAYQELLDLVAYTRNEIHEREKLNTFIDTINTFVDNQDRWTPTNMAKLRTMLLDLQRMSKGNP